MSQQQQHQKLFLKNYQEPDYWVENIELYFNLQDDHTLVTSKMVLNKNPNTETTNLLLNGDGQEILTFKINEKPAEPVYAANKKDLALKLPANNTAFHFEIQTKIYPKENKSFEGLYWSNGTYFTQNEAEGFRKITYYLDRPDVMATYSTWIEADPVRYPHLLSNGNPISRKTLPNGRMLVGWKDPFKKPSYLFALVAGDLAKVSDTFTTKSGRKVALDFFVDKGNENKVPHAMESLKQAMKWDEETFNLEYDLDIYMVVVADDFNSGAMENKGLNIFNAKYVLASPDTATDQDYYNIQAVIGHEYFHNYTGNRVTCRDWFQLSLKEGLTVFRDQEFSSDLNSRAVKRIDDVKNLRARQFPEDAGPNSHPVRPEEAYNISNFYTMTIYEKGAELIRMMQTIIGRENFKKGMKKYFELYDGKAVTTEDFVHAMTVASKIDLTNFKKWYSTPGTPKVSIQRTWNSKEKTLTIEFTQKQKQNLQIPMLIGFLDEKGKEIVPNITQASCKYDQRKEGLLLQLWQANESITLTGLTEKTIPSYLREFSAPILLENHLQPGDLEFLLAHETDLFQKWESCNQIYIREILARVANPTYKTPKVIFTALQSALKTYKQDPAFTAKLLEIPSYVNFEQYFEKLDIDQIFSAMQYFKKAFTEHLQVDLKLIYQEASKQNTSGWRALKNNILTFLTEFAGETDLAWKQFQTTNNMSDSLSAFYALSQTEDVHFSEAAQIFRSRFEDNALVLNKYFTIQVGHNSTKALDFIDNIEKDSKFQKANPNHIYAAYVGLAHTNPQFFHDVSGRGYEIVAKKIREMDKDNPYVAARVAGVFHAYSKLDEKRKKKMQVELEKILQTKELSSNTFEIISKTLKNNAT
jgi:aminopeptidase N